MVRLGGALTIVSSTMSLLDTFPLPLVEDCLDTLAGNTWFSKLDANSAYWQVKVKEEDRIKTAFLTTFGLFEHVKMGFGLTNAPASFSRVVSFLLKGLAWKTVFAFLDDILVLGKMFEEHVDNLCEVLKRFRANGIKLQHRKYLTLKKSRIIGEKCHRKRTLHDLKGHWRCKELASHNFLQRCRKISWFG